MVTCLQHSSTPSRSYKEVNVSLYVSVLVGIISLHQSDTLKHVCLCAVQEHGISAEGV